MDNMPTKEQVMNILEEAIGEISPMLGEPLKFSADLRLTGSQRKLDSLALVSLIATTEDLIVEKFNTQIWLVSEKAFSKGNSPFYSIETLCDYILILLGEKL